MYTAEFNYQIPVQVGFAKNSSSIKDLPKDWQLLHETAGLNSFAAVPVFKAKDVVAVFIVGDAEANRFSDPSWLTHLQTLGQWLGSLMRDGWMTDLVSMLEHISTADNIDSMVRAVSKSLNRLMSNHLLVRMQCRVALPRPDGAAAMVFEEIMQVSSPMVMQSRKNELCMPGAAHSILEESSNPRASKDFKRRYNIAHKEACTKNHAIKHTPWLHSVA